MGAWIGFQMGAGGDKTFRQYLEGFGLLEGQVGTVTTEMNAKEAIAKAEEILAMARKKE